MAKRKGTSKKLTAFRFSPAMLETLDYWARLTNTGAEVLLEGRIINPEITRTALLELAWRDWLKWALKQQISPKQIGSCATTNEFFRLFIQYVNAANDVEGYGFTAKDKKTRFVYGPASDSINPEIWADLEEAFREDVQKEKDTLLSESAEKQKKKEAKKVNNER